MSTLLRIDASANPGSSVSRLLTSEFAAAWQAARPVSAVIHRDLGLHAPPPLDLAKRSTSDILLQEFLSADAFVMGVPMYNFSVPAGFKAWIDHVVQFGRTVVRGPRGTEPVIKGRKALVFATRASDFAKGGPRDGWDFVGPYLEKVLPYVGIEPEILPVPTGRDVEARLAEAKARMQDVLARWSAAEGDVAGTGHEAAGKEAA